MSSALARARNRRAVPTENNQRNDTQLPSPASTQPSPRPNTINDIFNTIKIRLDELENNQKTISGNTSFSEQLISEYEARFETILSEITEMKDIIMKLQSFTMEVNKSLYDDRINILSNDANDVIIDIDNDENENEKNVNTLSTESNFQAINETQIKQSI